MTNRVVLDSAIYILGQLAEKEIDEITITTNKYNDGTKSLNIEVVIPEGVKKPFSIVNELEYKYSDGRKKRTILYENGETYISMYDKDGGLLSHELSIREEDLPVMPDSSCSE